MADTTRRRGGARGDGARASGGGGGGGGATTADKSPVGAGEPPSQWAGERRRAAGDVKGGTGGKDAPPSWSWLPEGVDPKFVRGLATFGLVISLWSVIIGMAPATEGKAWAAVFAAWVAIITYAAPVKVAGTALGAGAMCGFYVGLVRVLLYDWYVKSNHVYYGHYFDAGKGTPLQAQLLVLALSVVAGIVFGGANGVVSYLVVRLFGRQRGK